MGYSRITLNFTRRGRSSRVINQLRRLYPGKWVFDRNCPYKRWVRDNGEAVVARSHIVPGTDDYFTTEFYWENSNRRVHGVY